MKRKNLLALVLLIGSLILTACGNNASNEKPSEETKPAETTESTENTELVKVKIGTNPTPHGEVIDGLKDEFLKEGIEVENVEFTDYIQPNLALEDKNLDLNYYQHQPYLEAFNEEHGTHLAPLGPVHVEPLALFSAKYKSIEELPDGAEIVIPNDTSNGARALILLSKAGLISLKAPSDINATEKDIVDNPKNINFTAIEAVECAKAYADVDAGIINANYAIEENLNPAKDSILIEEADSPYANLLVSREGDENNEVYQKVLKVLQSEAAKKFIEEKFEGAVVPVK